MPAGSVRARPRSRAAGRRAVPHQGRPSPRPVLLAPPDGRCPAATLGGWRGTRRAPTATASLTSTTTGTATSPMLSLRPTRGRPGGGARRWRRARARHRVGRLALPLAALASRSTASTPRSDARSAARQAGGAALTLTLGDMAELELVDPPPFAVVFVAFNTFFNLSSPAAQRRASNGSRRCSRPRDCSCSRRSCPPKATTTHRSERGAAADHRGRGGAGRQPARRRRADRHRPAHPRHRGRHPAAPVAPPLRRSGPARRHGGGRRPPARVASRRLGRSPFTADASVHVSAYGRGNVRAVRSPGSAAP